MVDYRYELRRANELVATGRLTLEQPLEIGDRVEISRQIGTVRTADPIPGRREVRLVVSLDNDNDLN